MSASAGAISGGSTAHADVVHPTNTGLGNEWFGMILFVVSEAIMFGAFFAQYFYERVLAPRWPPQGYEGLVEPAPLALVLTVILAVSGITAHNAQTAIRRDDRDALQGWLVVTILLGVAFLAGQAFEYTSLFNEGFTISSGIFGSVFFTITGLHGLHVTGGVLVLTSILIRVFLGHFSSRSHFGIEGAVLYWHFVDVVWFLLYAALYLF